MKYKKLKDKIIIEDLSQFNINQILDCGQIFRYNILDNVAEVVSTDKYAQIITYENYIEIFSDDIDYFENFFDLKNDYNSIKNSLQADEFLAPCIKFGYGIRILNQNLFEMIVSFIISANNNIKRIKNSVNYLSKKFGSKKVVNTYINNQDTFLINGNILKDSPISNYNKQTKQVEYYAFPTLKQLKKATVEDYTLAGLGYRAEYMYNTIQKLTEEDLNNFQKLDERSRFEFLLSLKGIGEKVAHCILLFSMHQTSLFPVDTWINKVYNDLTNTNTTNRKEISRELTSRYKNLSGYAQQYFYYYYRELRVNN